MGCFDNWKRSSVAIKSGFFLGILGLALLVVGYSTNHWIEVEVFDGTIGIYGGLWTACRFQGPNYQWECRPYDFDGVDGSTNELNAARITSSIGLALVLASLASVNISLATGTKVIGMASSVLMFLAGLIGASGPLAWMVDEWTSLEDVMEGFEVTDYSIEISWSSAIYFVAILQEWMGAFLLMLGVLRTVWEEAEPGQGTPLIVEDDKTTRQ